MAPNWSMGNSYTDDRRGSGSRWESSSSSSYRPGDRDRPQASRHPRDLPPRPPDIKTNVRPPEGPRKMSSISPASADDKLVCSNIPLYVESQAIVDPREVFNALEKPVTTNSAIIEAPISAIPKAQKPELQEAFEVAYKWGEKSNKRLLLNMRKNKVAQERAQRDFETEKYKAKAAAYPPFNGLSHKPNPADQKLDEQFKAVEDDYRHHLEQLVACFTTVTKPAVSDHQDPVITALEAKVEQLSQLATKQSEQIQELRDGNAHAGNSVSSLEKDLISLKSSHSDLEARYTLLKFDHQTLQSKFRSYNDTIHALESKQVILDTGNMTLKEQLSDIQSNTEKKIGSFDTQMAELAKKTSDIADSWNVSNSSLNERITAIETKSHDYDEFKEMLDELDLAILNQISDAWVSDVYNLKAQHEEYKERRGQDNPSIVDELRSLRQDVESLRSSRPAVSQSDNGLTMSIQKVEELVNAEVTAAEERIINNSRAYSEKKDNLFSELLSDVEARLDTLEQRMPQLETRTPSLEQWKIASSDLSERVTRLEGQKIGHRVDRIDLNVGELDQKYEVLKGEIGQLVKQESLELRLQELLNSVSVNPGLENDVRDLQRKLPAIDLAVKTLDTQFQNLGTKQLAELIVRLTNPTIEQRLGKLEVRASQLEVKASGQDRAIIQHREQLSAILDPAVPGDKRTASPSQYDDPNKRRKLEANGRHPSPLQQQQQQSAQNISVQR
ncbi:hypothetical protein FHL15_008687 [Xylaria flabelliformis]|uniref:Uncharacterized protein n=1 Tax=Xylaria flabelliformis TaxID=2512241 RepID=A0A553HRF6_9PEZI|nr:hypothetical protein FHL15_008687 [Xylaria flabelliformis]